MGDIANDINTARKNGALLQTTTTDQGIGNFGSYVLFIGRRNNSGNPFNGRIFQLLVRGALSDTATVAQAERWVGGKTGVAIP